jgi:hypothetical protein
VTCASRRFTFPGLMAAAAIVAVTCTPASAQTGNFSLVAAIPGPVDLIEVHGARAYLVGGATLTVVDIQDPAAPRRLGSYTFPEKIWGIQVVEPLVYVAADFFGLGIVDVSDPSAPALRGSLKTPGQAKNVAVHAGKAAVADHMSGIDFIDTSKVDKPALLESFYVEGYARDVAASEAIAYAVDAPTGLYVFDLAKSGPVEPVTTQQSATAPGSIVISTGEGQKIAVLVGGGSLQVYDISKPAAPLRVATFRTPSGRPIRAALHGSHAFVADGREGLQVVDLSTPRSPRLVGSYKTPSPARDVAATDSLVFVVVGAAAETPREFKDQEVLILKRPL